MNVAAEVQNRADAYLQGSAIKSLLCIPVSYKGNLLGFVYLENRNLYDAFADEQRQSLEILISQAAISIANARLFADLKREKDYSDSIIANSPNLICGIDGNGLTQFVNPVVTRITGYTPEELLHKNWWNTLLADNPDDTDAESITALSQNPAANTILPIQCRNGERREIAWNTLVRKDREHDPREIIGFGVDITELKNAERQIRKDLEEREVLLRELYHRTKNNMQVIISLLKLKAMQGSNELLSEITNEICLKIQSMALVHQMLYQGASLSMINLDEYVTEIAENVLRDYTDGEENMQLDVYAETISVSIDVAVPLGMVLTELLTNTMKHAFPENTNGPEKTNGIVRIELQTDTQAGKSVLIYSDNGVGLPAGTDLRVTSSVGMQILFSVVENQLDGTLEYTSQNGGLTFTIGFNNRLMIDPMQ